MPNSHDSLTGLFTDIADAIREKTGSEESIVADEFPEAIAAIEAGGADEIQPTDLLGYVKAEVVDTAFRVKEHLRSDSIVFFAASDTHIGTTAKADDAIHHMGTAMKALAYALPLDFAAFLGDYTAGNSLVTLADGIGHIRRINSDIDEAFRGLPQFRTVGNHDPLGYSKAVNNNVVLTQEQLYALIGKYNAESGATMGSTVSGYCYKDFPAKNCRVICLNTADTADAETPPESAETMSSAQKTWFTTALDSTPEGYGIIILAHCPLDWGAVMGVSHILRAYVEDPNRNKSAWVLQFHGHLHTHTYDKLHWNNDGTGEPYNAWRIGTPNAGAGRENQYAGEGYYHLDWGTAETCGKTANTAEDTAFCVYVINPSEEKVYAIKYGASIDREIYWGNTPVAVTGVALDDSSGTLNPGSSISLSAVVSPANASNKAVTWTSSNTAVATVSASGVVTAVAVGTATITVTTRDGNFTDTFALTVETIPQGNLINTIGYYDGKRLSIDTGDLKEQDGGVVIDYIDLKAFRQSNNTVVIRTRGANFKQISNPYNNNGWVFYNKNKAKNTSGYLTEGSNSIGEYGLMITRSFANDSYNTMTLTISGLTSGMADTNQHYLRISGLGSGASIDLRINEDFDY